MVTKYDSTLILKSINVFNANAKLGVFLNSKYNAHGVILIDDVLVYNNTGIESNLIYFINIKSVLIKNSIFHDNKQTFIYSEKSGIYLKNVILRDLHCIDEIFFGCIGYFYKSNITMISCLFRNISSFSKKNILQGIYSHINFYNNTFEILNVYHPNYISYFQNSSIFIQNSQFSDYRKGILYLSNGILVMMKNHFFNNFGEKFNQTSNYDLFSTITCQMCEKSLYLSNIFLENTNFIKYAGVHKN